MELSFFGRPRRIAGGPFDAFEPPAIGVCLEVRSVKAHLASVTIDIADYAAPSPEAFVAGLVAVLRSMRAAPDLPVYIGCRAGIGRTGTVMAGLAKLAGVVDPILFVRAHHHPDAVETPAQEAAVAGLDVDAVWRGVA